MAMSLEQLSARLEAVCKDQLEASARLRDDFHRKVGELLVEAQGDAPDLTDAQAELFFAAAKRFEKMAEEM